MGRGVESWAVLLNPTASSASGQTPHTPIPQSGEGARINSTFHPKDGALLAVSDPPAGAGFGP